MNQKLTLSQRIDWPFWRAALALAIPIALLLLCAALIARFYPLGGEEWDRTKEELSRRHEEKQRAWEAEVLGK